MSTTQAPDLDAQIEARIDELLAQAPPTTPTQREVAVRVLVAGRRQATRATSGRAA
jgi:hypothetical protein